MVRHDSPWLGAVCLTGSLLLGSTVGACVDEDPAPVLIEIDYQVRCLDCQPRAADEPPHDIHALQGRMGFRVSCTRDKVGGTKIVSFSADNNERQINGNDGFSLAIRQAVPESDPGQNCRVYAR